MYRSLAAILTIGVCVSGFLCLGQEVTPQEGQGESRLSAEAMATLAEFQKYAVAWEESRTGKRDRSTFDMRTFLALIKDVGERKMRQATPDLLHILNNADQEGSAAEYCMNALKEIRDERAIVPLLGEVHRSATHARTIVALEALVAFERPVGPQIVLALRGENDLRKRRGLWAVRLLARDRIDELVLVKLSAEERPWFEVSEALDEAVTALLRDKDPLVRFEALQTHLLLHDGVLGPARKLLSDEENASVKFLLAHPAVAEHLADHDIRSALRKESPKVVAPAPEAYRKVSAWVSLDRTRSLRVSMTSTNLRLTEPLYALNEAVWIRVELKTSSPLGSSSGEKSLNGPVVIWRKSLPSTPTSNRCQLSSPWRRKEKKSVFASYETFMSRMAPCGSSKTTFGGACGRAGSTIWMRHPHCVTTLPGQAW